MCVRVPFLCFCPGFFLDEEDDEDDEDDARRNDRKNLNLPDLIQRLYRQGLALWTFSSFQDLAASGRSLDCAQWFFFTLFGKSCEK
jgi:hypothetical protein